MGEGMEKERGRGLGESGGGDGGEVVLSLPCKEGCSPSDGSQSPESQPAGFREPLSPSPTCTAGVSV